MGIAVKLSAREELCDTRGEVEVFSREVEQGMENGQRCWEHEHIGAERNEFHPFHVTCAWAKGGSAITTYLTPRGRFQQ